MKRKTPLRAKSPLKRKTFMRKVNPKRRQREKERAYGSKARRAWVQMQPCVVRNCPNRPCENAHVNPVGHPSGMGRKGDFTQIVPMCRAHHQEYHDSGQRTFEDCYELDLDFSAILTNDRWLQYRERYGG